MAEIANGVTESAETNTASVEAPTTETNASTESSEDEQFVLGLEEPDEATESNPKEEEATSEPEQPKEQPTRAEKRNQQLNSDIRNKVAERNALRDEIAALERRKAELATGQNSGLGGMTVEALVNQVNPETGDYYTTAEAQNAILGQRLNSLERQIEINQYAERVADSITQISDEANRVVSDFPVFDPTSDQYNEALAKEADELMESMLIVNDRNEIIGSRVSPYKLYSTIAKAKASGEVSGKTSGRKAAMDMMKNVDVSSSGKAPSSKDEDDDFVKGLLGE